MPSPRAGTRAPGPVDGTAPPVAASGLHVDRDVDGASLEEAVFGTVRRTLDLAALSIGEIDAVVIAADDVSDGRSITTMLLATAAGAYFKDEIRVTGGSLTAVALAASRVRAGLSANVAVVAWWRPTAGVEEIARTTLDPTVRSWFDPGRLAPRSHAPAAGSCIVGQAGGAHDELLLDGWAASQAGYDAWLSASGEEPEAALRRLAEGLQGRCEDLAPARLSVPEAAGDGSGWDALADALAIRAETRSAPYGGIADGLCGLSELTEGAGERGEQTVLASTGLPPWLRNEAIVVRSAR